MNRLPHPEKLALKRLDPEAQLFSRAHADDAGMDIYALEDVLLGPGLGSMAKTGVAMAVPQGYVGMVADRSSMAKKGVKTAGGIIDAGYRGEVKIILRNLTQEEILLQKGERIAQMLIIPIATPALEEVEDLGDTQRGEGGFGSTGA